MKNGTAKEIIRKIAQREGVEESEVRMEMQKAILFGLMKTRARQNWNRLFGSGKLPSPEEFITKISDIVAK